MRSNVSVIIPAYNEAVGLETLIHEIKVINPDFEIVVVDDGSTDSTSEVAMKAGALVVRHPYNLGNGAAVKTGVKKASGEYLLMIDADGQHSPQDIPKLLEGFDHYDMIVGERSRHAPVSRFRRAGNDLFVAFSSYLAGRKIPDLTSGFRAVKRARMLEFLHLFPNGFSYPSTITMAMVKTGYPVQYIPFQTIVKRSSGKSKIKPFRDGFRFMMIIMRMGMLFSPMKLFLPASFFLLGAGFLMMLIQIFRFNMITNSALLMSLSGVIIFFVGLLADQLANLRREIVSSRTL